MGYFKIPLFRSVLTTKKEYRKYAIMNELQLLNDFVINHFESDNLVNTITIVPTINIDANKENIYPLVNIDLINSEVLSDAIIGSYKLTIITQRDIQPKKT